MKQNSRRFLLFSLFLIITQLTFAQEKEIQGTVTSKADGSPIPDASVLVKGTTNGAQTDFDGNYALTASVGDALSLINPDDIELLTVLKGASASALYGSAGLNGVILITTKTGRTG